MMFVTVSRGYYMGCLLQIHDSPADVSIPLPFSWLSHIIAKVHRNGVFRGDGVASL